MKNFIAILIFSVFASFAIVSCNKRDKAQSPADMLAAGKWKLMQIATDDNHNHKLDDNEIKNVASNDVEALMFNKDNTGDQNVTFNGNDQDYPFTWQLFGTALLYRYMAGNDTIKSSVITLAQSTLTLEDSTVLTNDSTVLSWYFYKR
ncbi:MAG TPA: hypothetical protein VN721_14900 [Flavipsychrobacter sp.]|nr:hypothetical protein [Flavipsychrobacter sp.]